MNRILAFAVLASLGVLAFAAPSLPLDSDDALLAALSDSMSQKVASSAVADVESSVASSRLVRYIRISSVNRADWMSISWVACFDRSGKNVCAGKAASASNGHGGGWGEPSTPLSAAENTNTGHANAFITGNQASSNWWRVDLGAPGFDLKEIRFRGRNDCMGGCTNQYSNLVITMEDKDGNTLPGSQNQFTTTAASGVQTFKVVGNVMGYEGKHDEHLAPIVDLLESLKEKLRKTLTAVQSEVAESKKKRDAIRTEAAKADGQYEAASKEDELLKSKSDKELEMIDKIMAMVHTLNGKS